MFTQVGASIGMGRLQRRLQRRRAGTASGGEEREPMALAEKGFSGNAGSLPGAERIGRQLGADLSGVKVYNGPAATEACDALGAEAYTVGGRIAFRDSSPSLGLQAHEATHVAQQGAVPSSRPLTFGKDPASGEEDLEREADAVAERVAGPGALPPRESNAGSVGEGRVQKFSPAGHREATIDGLTGAFSPEEIGKVYAANWERDFSQGAPQIADMVLSWRAVKQAAADSAGGGDALKAAAERFKIATAAVLNMSTTDALAESMGGYRSWEHLDNPSDSGANQRWGLSTEGQKGKSGQLPGYILDGRAYLKDEMVQSVESYRTEAKLGSAGSFDNWKGGKKPEGYGQPHKVRDPNESRGVIAEETAEEARKKPGALASGGKNLPDPCAFEKAAPHLGRATHVLEDFFAHSNWLELAKELKGRLSKEPAAVAAGNVFTGTFEMPDKVHALGHKLVALSVSLQNDMDLLAKVFDRQGPSTVLDDAPHAKEKAGLLSALQVESWSLVGEVYDVSSAAGAANSATRNKKKKVDLADIVLNLDWLRALEQKGRHMVDKGHGASPPTGHGKIAKDQPEASHGGGAGEKDFAGAHALAKVADRMIIAPLAIALTTGAGEVHQLVDLQLQLVDQVIAAPGKDHPLMPLVNA